MGQPVVHFEIGGKDGKKLRSFYAKNFGWKINAKNPMNYGVVDTAAQGKGIAGGIFETMPEQAPRVVTVYIEVKKIDPVLKKIEKAGGKTAMERTVLPGMVTLAQFTDPAGNLIGLVESDIPAAETPGGGAKKAGRKKVGRKKAAAKKAKAKKAGKKAKTKKAKAKKAAPKKAAGKKAKAKKVAPKKARTGAAPSKKAGAKKARPKKAGAKKARPRKAPPKELAAPEATPVDFALGQTESSRSEDMTQD